MLPLQVIDSFLLGYNLGQALLLVFVLATFGALPLKSRKLLAINAILFGVVFMVVPSSPVHYMYLGIVLLVVGPMLYATASR